MTTIISFEAHAQRRRADHSLAEANTPKLADLIPAYERYLVGEKRSAAGRGRYLWALRRVITWLDQELGRSSTMADLTRERVRRYKEDLGARCENATVINALAVVRDFACWAIAEELRTDDPTAGIKRPPKKRPDPNPLYEDEIEVLIRAIAVREGTNARTRFYDERNRLAVLIFLFSGMRLSEVAGLHWYHIHFGGEVITIRGDAGAKGGRDRTIPLHPRLAELLLEVPAERRKLWKPIIAKANGEQLAPKGVARIFERWLMKRLKDALGDEAFHVYAHRLRHTLASLLVWEGEELPVVQEILGHAQISTTEHYVRVKREQKDRAIRRLPDFGA